MRVKFFLFVVILLISTITLSAVKLHNSTSVMERDLYSQFDRCAKNNLYDKLVECFSDLITRFIDKDPGMLPQISATVDKYARDEKTTLDHALLHLIFHDVGMYLYYKVGNPREAYSLCEDSQSDAGCHNAVMLEHADNIKDTEYDPIKLMDEVCYSNTPNGLSLSNPVQCMHGIGHTTIYKRYGNIQRALDDCDRFPEELIKNCYRGLFMEYSKGEAHLGRHSHNSTNSISLPCEDMPTNYQPYCYAALASMQLASSPAGAGKICNKTGDFTFDCYKYMTKKILRFNKRNFDKSKRVCDSLPEESASLCNQAILYNIKIHPERYTL